MFISVIFTFTGYLLILFSGTWPSSIKNLSLLRGRLISRTLTGKLPIQARIPLGDQHRAVSRIIRWLTRIEQIDIANSRGTGSPRTQPAAIENSICLHTCTRRTLQFFWQIWMQYHGTCRTELAPSLIRSAELSVISLQKVQFCLWSETFATAGSLRQTKTIMNPYSQHTRATHAFH